ncbi:lipopolysaccharide assembly protein LapB [Ferrovum myxofaciens]|jgi:lipopolysaccharide biosynthesis regulator YciM|uniref:Lipopolysaccharide assembly protein B n=2 Tax=root TaxID=1 RepID=A0A9E6MXG7_9PROT|nr:lipopolysaccharide assembly protein LapB [Ferrovum myxofaciens]MBW8029031.1 lipopolysaccharide assembly protein LapB [Ferrovum sp.]NDU88505.1 lipopolysaccharide assembly protein LapB [Ferrovum sp.]QKE37759.1 MAG: lipopolysaccharide assembly protein LapB [Ferrovum myxofaciens]QWY75427.1 MAG: lipopolysaccharide assembly protein LapB [Ferrovum myxofaciens]QWY78167.1 MAG: lipopolysaccharide assembly protein LapB [Ferrovum myxofaciens]
MDFQVYWLLALPVFFGLGWLAARVDIRHLLTESRALPASYFKGLNLLLNEQPDKAIESFIEVARAEQQTVELQFALGGLFRRRGEVDRATRMHQNLVERTDLGPQQRTEALYELALDFLKAGLLDRAEPLFERLKDSDYEESALHHLLDIHVTEKDWTRAIQVARVLEQKTGEDRRGDMANFYCELAILAHTRSQFEEAQDFLKQALETQRNCVRAYVLRGEWTFKAGRVEEACAQWQELEQRDPDYLFLVARPLSDALRQLGQVNEAVTLMQGWMERYPNLDLLSLAFQLTLEIRGVEDALRLVRAELERRPTLGNLDRFLEAQLVSVAPELRAEVQRMRDIVHGHYERLAFYQCRHCGFKARSFHWHCPACGNWDSYPPRRQVETEGSAVTR